MIRTKKHSKDDLAEFSNHCPIFKKYCQFNLWSEEFSEYDNVKYCGVYISRYIHAYTQDFLLKYFSPTFLSVLYTSSFFMKFVKSGFIKYIDYHFLLFFKCNFFLYSSRSSCDIETFVEQYFQRHIKRSFEEDLLICLTASVNELVPKSLQGRLNSGIKLFYARATKAQLIDTSLSGGIGFKSGVGVKKGYISGFLGCGYSTRNLCRYSDISTDNPSTLAEKFLSSFFGPNTGVYKSPRALINYLDPVTLSFANLGLADSMYSWGIVFRGHNNNRFILKHFSRFYLKDKSSCSSRYLHTFSNNPSASGPYYLISLGYEWCFYSFFEASYKPFPEVAEIFSP